MSEGGFPNPCFLLGEPQLQAVMVKNAWGPIVSVQPGSGRNSSQAPAPLGEREVWAQVASLFGSLLRQNLLAVGTHGIAQSQAATRFGLQIPPGQTAQ